MQNSEPMNITSYKISQSCHRVLLVLLLISEVERDTFHKLFPNYTT
jgi:hypothetical protein